MMAVLFADWSLVIPGKEREGKTNIEKRTTDGIRLCRVKCVLVIVNAWQWH